MTSFPEDSSVPDDFHMFSTDGNAAVRQAVLATAQDLRNGADREAALAALRRRTAAITAEHSEVSDTDAVEQIAEAIDPFLEAAGLPGIEAQDEIVD